MKLLIIGIIAVVCGLLYRRISDSSQKTSGTTKGFAVPEEWKNWVKSSWWKYLPWAIFALVVFNLFRKFVFPNVPVELKDWIPGFSWNTAEIIIAIIGVVILWGKRGRKKTGMSSESGGIVITNIPYTHNPPPVMYNGIPQVKWVSSTGESVWNAVAIPIVILAVLSAVVYASNETQGLVNFWKWVTAPAKLSMGLMVLFVTTSIMAFLHKSDCFPVLVIGFFFTIVGYLMFGGNWFTVHEGASWWMGTTVPAVVMVLPAATLSCYALWKSDFTDWRIPGIFEVLLLVALY